MKDEKTRLWNEHLDMICEKDSWGNRPCDTYGYCMCAISCNEDWFIKAFAIKLKEAGTYQIALDDGSSKSIYLVNKNGRIQIMLHQVQITENGTVKVKCRLYDTIIEPNTTIEKHIRMFIHGQFVSKFNLSMV